MLDLRASSPGHLLHLKVTMCCCTVQRHMRSKLHARRRGGDGTRACSRTAKHHSMLNRHENYDLLSMLWRNCHEQPEIGFEVKLLPGTVET